MCVMGTERIFSCSSELKKKKHDKKSHGLGHEPLLPLADTVLQFFLHIYLSFFIAAKSTDYWYHVMSIFLLL